MKRGDAAGESYWALVEPVWGFLNSAWGEGDDDDCESFILSFQSVGRAGHLYAAHWCQSEVCNGGHFQFFHNTTGILAPEALEAFQAMGLVEWADILAKAMRFFGPRYPRRRATRMSMLDSIVDRQRKRREWDPFNDLDDQFYAWLHAGKNRWEIAADDYAKQIEGINRFPTP